MPPQDGITVAHFLTVADIERSLRFYETVFGGRILSRGDSKGAPGYMQIANTWLIVNVGGGPTPDKPSVTLSVPADPDLVSSFMNIRVADIQACYELWRSRGAEFITEPKPQIRRDALLHSPESPIGLHHKKVGCKATRTSLTKLDGSRTCKASGGSGEMTGANLLFCQHRGFQFRCAWGVVTECLDLAREHDAHGEPRRSFAAAGFMFLIPSALVGVGVPRSPAVVVLRLCRRPFAPSAPDL